MDLSKIENFQDAVVTVMGLGRNKRGSGLDAAKWLMKHGAQTVITDLKDSEELKESVELVMAAYEELRTQVKDRTIYQPIFVLGEHRREDFVNVQCVVQNPGVPSESEYVAEAKQNGIAIESDVSLFFRFFPHPTIAVTGTKGKTTTSIMIGEMLRGMDAEALIAGNIQRSPIASLDELIAKGRPTPVVIELSSWMLESMPGAWSDMRRGADIAVLTNVYPDHLDRYHGSFDDYKKSKHIIFEHQSADQATVLNYDHADVRAMESLVKGKLYWFSTTAMVHDGCYVKDGNIVFVKDDAETVVLPVAEVALQGESRMENVLSAVCAAMLRGVPVPAVQKVLREFVGSMDREELVREVDEITYINDTNAITSDAAAAAIAHVAGSTRRDVVLIAGGSTSGSAYQALADAAVKSAKLVILFPGEASLRIEEAVAGKVPVEHVGTMREAVRKARSIAQKGDVVLLSPAASSEGMFASDYERGEMFREEVRNL